LARRSRDTGTGAAVDPLRTTMGGAMRTPAILSVLGEDRVGIVAAVSSVLAQSGANIEDIRQTIIGGIFSMTMLVTIDEDVAPFDEVQKRLSAISEELGVQITLQREDVFRFMHRV
jgi:ACT domain-containing protein